MSRSRLAAAAIFLALAAVGVAVRALWPKPVVVYCDNGTNEDITVKVDGAEKLSVPRHDVRRVDVPPGVHALAAMAGGRTVDEWRLDGLPGQRWVWNVAGANEYALYTMAYGDAQKAPPPRQLAPGLKHFVMPAEAAPDFGQPLPSTVTVARGTEQATQKGLFHFPLHPGRPCCVAIVRQASQTN